jgi:hypothetical protein
LEKNIDLHQEFASDVTEKHTINASLAKLRDFCADEDNAIPMDVFDKFAKFAKFSSSSCSIDPSGKIKSIDDLQKLWNKFSEKEDLKLKP